MDPWQRGFFPSKGDPVAREAIRFGPTEFAARISNRQFVVATDRLVCLCLTKIVWGVCPRTVRVILPKDGSRHASNCIWADGTTTITRNLQHMNLRVFLPVVATLLGLVRHLGLAADQSTGTATGRTPPDRSTTIVGGPTGRSLWASRSLAAALCAYLGGLVSRHGSLRAIFARNPLGNRWGQYRWGQYRRDQWQSAEKRGGLLRKPLTVSGLAVEHLVEALARPPARTWLASRRRASNDDVEGDDCECSAAGCSPAGVPARFAALGPHRAAALAFGVPPVQPQQEACQSALLAPLGLDRNYFWWASRAQGGLNCLWATGHP
jgi:hypothetical protein